MSEPQVRTGSGDPPVEALAVEEVRAAANRIGDVGLGTPLLRFNGGEPGPSIWLKAECLQGVGSFKIRGVYNWARSLSPTELATGFSTHSAGNTAQALGYVAQLMGVPARSLLPDDVAEVKLSAVRRYGVTPIPVPFSGLMEYVFDKAWEEEPYSFLNPWGDRQMLAGSGTIAIELLEERPNLKAIYVPVGGGGLISAIGSITKELRPDVQVIGVQSESCQSLAAAFRAGGPTWVETSDTICDGTIVPVVVDEMYPLLKAVVDRVVVITEQQARAAIAALAMKNKLVVEGSGAMALAAAMAEDRQFEAACVLSGGSIGPNLLADVLTREWTSS